MKRGRETGLILVAAVVLVGVAGWLISTRVLNNAQEIAKRPTNAELLGALKAVRADQRRACRVINVRFAALGKLVGQQAPDPKRTAYYRQNPGELKRARSYFVALLAVLEPRNCLKAYPVPTLEDVKGVVAPPGHSKQPP